MKRLIITGDDFGLAVPINEAIEQAHCTGVLSCASLMVGAKAAADAVERAKRLPDLKVGLHLVLVDGCPILPPETVPDLVDARGEFHRNLVAAGSRFFFGARARRQLEAEIEAQFSAFQKTGLLLDHVNAHNHMHLHPTVLGLILKHGGNFGFSAMRVPFEPPLISWRAVRTRLVARLANGVLLAPWIKLLRWRLHRAGIRANDAIFGLNDSGAMEESLVLRLLEQLPEGVTELYFHPATRRCPEIAKTMPDYRHEEELNALMSPKVREAMKRLGLRPNGFTDLSTIKVMSIR